MQKYLQWLQIIVLCLISVQMSISVMDCRDEACSVFILPFQYLSQLLLQILRGIKTENGMKEFKRFYLHFHDERM